MNTQKRLTRIGTLLVLVVVVSMLFAPVSYAQDGRERPAGWDEYSHSNSTDPDYAVVFPQNNVNTMTITISPETWAAMQANMTDLYGEFGTRAMGFGGVVGIRPDNGQVPEGFQPGQLPEGFQPGQVPEGGIRGQGGPGGMGGNVVIGTGENPMWAAVDISFNGEVWTNVGMRFKGNSSLAGAWGSGVLKMGFKLDFDEFEDAYPEINNQRFYGFKQLTFSSNWGDDSLLREKVVADIFREAGVPSAQTAFYAVYVDYGAGPNYFGLYTAVEAVEDTVIQTQFDDDSGNLYKPEGNGATFAADTFSEEAFDKETNKKAADYSDILALFDALHADTRSTDPATWRSNLEAVFDVDGFIRWLAVNTVIQNWDTYGSMSHNYYLYNDPTTGLLTWIPWDNNLALSGRGGGPGGPGGFTNDSLNQASVSNNWPLIRYLMDDPTYYERYVAYVAATAEGAFAPERMIAIYQKYHAMVAPYVVGENGEVTGYSFLTSAAAFDASLTELITHVNQRYAAVQAFLAAQ